MYLCFGPYVDGRARALAHGTISLSDDRPPERLQGDREKQIHDHWQKPEKRRKKKKENRQERGEKQLYRNLDMVFFSGIERIKKICLGVALSG